MRLLFVGTELLDGPTGQYQTDHVEHSGHTRERTFEKPLRLMGRSETLSTYFDRPVNAGLARGVEMLLPGQSLVDEIGRADRAVVAGRQVFVGGEPFGRLLPEFFDADHGALST